VSFGHTQSVARRFVLVIGVLAGLGVLAGTARCSANHGPIQPNPSTTLRVGVGGLAQQAAEAGMRQFVGSLSIEGLAIPDDDGRLRPWLAESWTTAADGLSLTIQLHRNAKFHDGTPVTGSAVAEALRRALPPLMGPAFEDVAQITALDDLRVRVDLHRRSQFVVEAALETIIQKPGGIGTGKYIAGPTTATSAALKANADYYLERPAIDQITVTPYPTVRAAWADLLRGNLDMLSEVSVDALDSLQGSSNVAVFSFVRHYQYTIFFGRHAPMFQSAEVRRELTAAIDRDEIVREALNGHGVASTGPVPPEHWAASKTSPPAAQKQSAKLLANRHLKFTCLVPADSVYERVALAVRRQLAAVSVDMQVDEVSQEHVVEAAANGNYDAILVDVVSGPTLFRSYRYWYSRSSAKPRPLVSAAIDDALDQIRHAESEDEYRNGVKAFQQAIENDPPALFLAWGERARAISRRFDVPTPEKGRDVLNSIRLWRPAGTQQVVRTN
jgi:peptide/nickel transport system substrate-binding protein